MERNGNDHIRSATDPEERPLVLREPRGRFGRDGGALASAASHVNRVCDRIDRARVGLGMLIDELEDGVAICGALDDGSRSVEVQRALARADRLLGQLSDG